MGVTLSIFLNKTSKFIHLIRVLKFIILSISQFHLDIKSYITFIGFSNLTFFIGESLGVSSTLGGEHTGVFFEDRHGDIRVSVQGFAQNL